MDLKPTAVTKNKEKKKFSEIFVDYMSGIMLPIMPVLCGSGIIKGILSILLATSILKNTDNLYILLNAISNAVIYFFPTMLGFTAAKKFGMSPMTGATLGAFLTYPDLLNLKNFSLMGFKLGQINYSSSVLPIILIIMLATPLEKLLNKKVPANIKLFTVPLIVLLVAGPVGYCVIGPFANWIANIIGTSISGVYHFSPIICSVLIAGFWQVLVIFGLHQTIGTIIFMDFLSQGSSFLMTLLDLPSFSQTGTVLAMGLRTKSKKLKELAYPSAVSAFFGVTEPAIYGVTLPRIKYFIISCISSGFVGLYCALTGIKMYQNGGMGIFTITRYIAPNSNMWNVTNYIIAIVISLVLSFILTFVLFKDNKEDLDNNRESSNKNKKLMDDFVAPIKGKKMSLSQVNDPAFSNGAMGKGVAIDPVEGKVVAPADATVRFVFPTKHAIGLVTSDGVEILIHVGTDTVKLNGKYFTSFVKQGQKVKKGQLLLTFDIPKIKKAGYSVVTPVVITNFKDSKQKLKITSNNEVDLGQPLMSIN